MSDLHRISVPLQADNATAGGSAPAPAAAEAAVAPARPEGLPDKFWDANTGKMNTEALIQSYNHLESKLGGKPAEPAAEAANPTNVPEPMKSAHEVSDADLKRYGQEYARDGALSEATYKELAGRGYAKPLVDQWVAGQVAIREQRDNAVMADVGGAEAYSGMVAWASKNLTAEERTAFNDAVNGDLTSAKMAVKGLHARYQNESSSPPARRVSGGTTGLDGSSGDTYVSFSEFVEDAKKPEYQSSESFRLKCTQKLQRSQV